MCHDVAVLPMAIGLVIAIFDTGPTHAANCRPSNHALLRFTCTAAASIQRRIHPLESFNEDRALKDSNTVRN